MNDPMEPQSEERQDAELLAFEQQLRSLPPRVANFVLTEQPQVEIAGAVQETSSTRSFARRIAWAATLLVTWSLGAAVGVLVTLAYLQPRSVDGSAQDSMAQNTANIGSGVMPQDSQSSDLPQRATAAPNPSVEGTVTAGASTGPAGKTQVQEPNPFAMAVFPWQALAAPEGDADTLTPRSRLSQGTDFGSSASRPAKLVARTSPSAGQQDDHGIEPLSPVKIDGETPANQRDMLRRLLDTYGAIF